MKTVQLTRAIVATIALFAAGTSSFAQNPAQTTAGRAGRALTDYVPVPPSTLRLAWVINPKKGVETREVANGVFVITDGVWQSAFAVTDAGVVVFDAPETSSASIHPIF